MRYVEVDEVKDLKILADRSSVEVFVRNYVTKYEFKIRIIIERKSPYIKRKNFSREILSGYMVIFLNARDINTFRS